MRRRRPQIRATGEGFVIELSDDESSLVLRLLDEMRQLLTDPTPDTEGQLLIVRLFPVAHPDDEEAEAEYQRLMRDELVQSKLASIARVEHVLELGRRDRSVDEGEMVAFMQSINAIRLVLGTMLGVSDDPDADEVTDGKVDSPEYHLYAYLSWLLEQCVRAISGS